MKKIGGIILIAAGVLSLILGAACFGKSTGSYAMSHKYGGDAYTGIQNAAATTANNVSGAAEIVRFGFGSVLLVGGISLIGAGLPSLKSEAPAPDPSVSAPTAAVSEPASPAVPEPQPVAAEQTAEEAEPVSAPMEEGSSASGDST